MRHWSLAKRMIAAVNTVVAVTLGLLIYLQVRQAASNARAQAFQHAEDIAHRYGDEVGRTLNDAMLAARTVAQTFEGMKTAWVDDRSLYNSILKQVLLANTNFIAVWSCWEPDALDGKDKDFVGKAGHDATGRFIPAWHRAGTDAKLENLSGYSLPGTGNYYLKVKAADKELPLDPQLFKAGAFEEEVIGMTVPMHYNSELIGVVGVLLPARQLQASVEVIISPIWRL